MFFLFIFKNIFALTVSLPNYFAGFDDYLFSVAPYLCCWNPPGMKLVAALNDHVMVNVAVRGLVAFS